MPFSISRLFQPKAAALKDGLSQEEREAIADLLHFCMYADNHIAIAETKAVSDTINMLAWDPKISFESFEARSIGAARGAKENAETRKQFLESIRRRLNSSHSRALALDACKHLFIADGMDPKEASQLKKISDLLA